MSSSSKLAPSLEKALSAGSLAVGKTSFVYGKAVTNALSSNTIIGLVLPQIISMFTKLASTLSIKQGKMKATSSSVRALAYCVTHPVAKGDKSPGDSIESTICTVLDYQPISDALVDALFVCVNEQFVESGSDNDINVEAVRQIAVMLAARSLSASCGRTKKGLVLLLCRFVLGGLVGW